MDVTQKAEILERNRASRSAWESALASLSEEQRDRPATVGEWSLRDVIAHVAADDRWFAAQLSALQRGEVPTAIEAYGSEEIPAPELDFNNQDDRNAFRVHLLRGTPTPELLRISAEASARREEILRSLPEAEFHRNYTIAENAHVGHIRPAAEGEWGVPLWQWVRGNAWHHYEDHTATIRAFLAAEGGS